ncbi:MAG: ABC transporter ATP-binding protein [Epsilonproteobacteria bacterium]|nr:MAG: ABC transporter ATP-binding protein [Campylobacterota bacterium]
MIKIKNLYKIYNQNKADELQALKNISININKNELIILKGISGSGKSTLLSVISSFTKPTSGVVICDNNNISKLPDRHASIFRNKSIGFVFQAFNLIDELTVYDNIKIPLSINNNTDIENKIKTAIKQANISHKSKQYIKNLSGGEKQRVAIARAIVNNPNIILCDEPTAALDKNNSLRFINILKQLKKTGKTIVVATHDSLFDELDFVDRYIDIEDGKIKP